MATMVESLFGITPEMYQQAQNRRVDEAARQYAQMDPFERANYGLYRGASNLVGALGGMLGVEDPELQRISTRNAIARQIDYTDPASMQQGIQALAQAGDTVGAMQLTDVLRKLQSEQALAFQRTAAGQASLAAATRERGEATPEKARLAQQFALRKGPPGSPEYEAEFTAQLTRLTTAAEKTAATPEKILLARELAGLKGAPGSPEYQAEYNAQLARLTSTERPEAMTAEMRNAAALAALKGAPGSPEYAAEYNAQLSRLTTKTERGVAVGTDREAVSLEVYNKPFADLTPDERAVVNKRVEAEQGKKAAAGAPKFELPGQKALVDIPGFRAKVQATIRPQLDAINSADQALTSIKESLATGNFVSFNAARVQLAKSLGDSQLSRRDIEQAGGDPSLLGGFFDATSRLFSGVPTADTQRKIEATLNAIRTVAAKKARDEVNVQRDIALASPGYDAAAVNRALAFPELAAPPAPQGTLAEQAAAELARRRGEKK